MFIANSIRKIACLSVLALPLGACLTTDVEDVAKVEARGSAFDKALTEEYRRLALYESQEMYDWPDAGYFARKGLAAADGKQPLPEKVADWNLAYGARRLDDANKRLSALMARGAAKTHPRQAAKAQAAYDCWVEQVEEGWQIDHIAACHDAFQTAAVHLERQLNDPYRISFALNDYHLNGADRAIIRKLGEEALRRDAPVASIVGFADRSGDADYNMTLSLKRADAVRDVLRKAGLPEDRIAVSAYGEDRPLLATADNVPSSLNRRVEILFYPASGPR